MDALFDFKLPRRARWVRRFVDVSWHYFSLLVEVCLKVERRELHEESVNEHSVNKKGQDSRRRDQRQEVLPVQPIPGRSRGTDRRTMPAPAVGNT